MGHAIYVPLSRILTLVLSLSLSLTHTQAHKHTNTHTLSLTSSTHTHPISTLRLENKIELNYKKFLFNLGLTGLNRKTERNCSGPLSFIQKYISNFQPFHWTSLPLQSKACKPLIRLWTFASLKGTRANFIKADHCIILDEGRFFFFLGVSFTFFKQHLFSLTRCSQKFRKNIGVLRCEPRTCGWEFQSLPTSYPAPFLCGLDTFSTILGKTLEPLDHHLKIKFMLH